MRLKLTAIALALVAVSAVAGASAFSTATLERDASVDVVTDDNGIVGLSPGIQSDIVSTNGGALSIDFAQNNATGVNSDAVFELGDNASANTTYAFKLTNQDTVSHTFDLAYAPNANAPTSDGVESLQFEVYSYSGGMKNSVGTLSEETGSQSPNSLLTVAPAESLYVVVIVDTTGLTDADDLSGTLTVSA